MDGIKYERFSQFKLTKGLILLFVVIAVIFLYYAFPASYYDDLDVQAQLQLQQQQQQSQQQQKPPPPIIGIKIISPSIGQQVPVGQHTISGTSTDNATTDCTVYADWNNTKPFQKAIATGPGGVDDYSTWAFMYTNKNHLITNGTNELTSKLSCINNNVGDTVSLTKFYSVNVIGVTASTTDNKAGAPSSEEIQQLESFAIDANNTATTAISNEAAIAVEEERLGGKDDISSLTSIPIPLVANNFTFDGVNVNITSHKSGQEVPVGNLTIVGYSSDNLATNCTVYVSWDSQTPLQIAKHSVLPEQMIILPGVLHIRVYVI